MDTLTELFFVAHFVLKVQACFPGHIERIVHIYFHAYFHLRFKYVFLGTLKKLLFVAIFVFILT